MISERNGSSARTDETLHEADDWQGGFATTLDDDPCEAAVVIEHARPVVRSGVVVAGSSRGADASAEPAEPFAPGTVLLGKLSVIRLLGRGGMGSVYEVEHVLTRHRRALKVLHADLAKEAGLAARFTREVGVAARIASPFVVETYDAGTLEDGTPYALMELLDGETLARRLEREGRVRPREAVAIVAELAQGVVAAHRAGIIHRDLKPENVFLVPRSADHGAGSASPASSDVRVRILDFGIARPLSSSWDGATALTATGAVLGTPYYIAPEYAAAETPDERVDVYALGVILYELLSGKKPFDDANLFALLGQIIAGDALPLRAVAPHVSVELEAIVHRAMARDPDDRYASAAWLLADLEALLARLEEAERGVVPTDLDDNAKTVVRDVERSPSSASDLAPRPSTSFFASFRTRQAVAIIGVSLVLGAALGGALALLR